MAHRQGLLHVSKDSRTAPTAHSLPGRRHPPQHPTEKLADTGTSVFSLIFPEVPKAEGEPAPGVCDPCVHTGTPPHP